MGFIETTIAVEEAVDDLFMAASAVARGDTAVWDDIAHRLTTTSPTEIDVTRHGLGLDDGSDDALKFSNLVAVKGPAHYVFPELGGGKKYRWKTARTITTGGVHVRFEGSVDWQVVTGNAALQFVGSEGATKLVNATVVAGDGYAPVGSADIGTFQVGQVVRLGSNKGIDPGTSTANGNPLGELKYVSLVDTDLNRVYFRSPVLHGPYNPSDGAVLSVVTLLDPCTASGSGLWTGAGVGGGQTCIRFDRVLSPRVYGGLRFTDMEIKAVEFWDCPSPWAMNIGVDHSNKAGLGYGVIFGWNCIGGGVSHSRFRDCRHATTTGGGLSRRGICRLLTFSFNYVENSIPTGDAMDCHAAGEYMTFAHNRIYDAGGNGIQIECPSAKVVDNIIVRPAHYGFYLINRTFEPTRYVASGNEIYSPLSMGIRYGTTNGLLGTGNVSTAGQGGTIDFVKIHDNLISRPRDQAILSQSSDPTIRVQNVEVYNNTCRSPLGTVAFQMQQGDYCRFGPNYVSDAPGNITSIVRAHDLTNSIIDTGILRCSANAGDIATTLAAPMTGADATIEVASAAGWASKGVVTVEAQRWRYTGLTGTTLTGVTPYIFELLDAAIGDTDVTLDLATDVDLLPAAPYTLRVGDEQITYTAKTPTVIGQDADGNDITVVRVSGLTRGANGTAAVPHDAKVKVYAVTPHASGAAVATSAAVAILCTSVTYSFIKAGIIQNAFYGLQLDNNCHDNYYEVPITQGVTIPTKLGTGVNNRRNLREGDAPTSTFTTTVGDGASSSFTVTHNLGVPTPQVTVARYSPYTATVDNLFDNPVLAANSTHWGPSNSSGLTVVQSGVRAAMPDGGGDFGWHLQVTNPDTTLRGAGPVTTPNTIMPVVAGETYAAAAVFFCVDPPSDPNYGLRVDLLFYASDGATQLTTMSGNYAVPVTGGRQKVTMSAVAPAGAAYVRVLPRALTAVSGDVIDMYVTGIVIVHAASVPRGDEQEDVTVTYISDTAVKISAEAWTASPPAVLSRIVSVSA